MRLFQVSSAFLPIALGAFAVLCFTACKDDAPPAPPPPVPATSRTSAESVEAEIARLEKERDTLKKKAPLQYDVHKAKKLQGDIDKLDAQIEQLKSQRQ